MSNYLHSFSGSRQTKIKRGIVNECCSVPCKRKYIKDYYCAPEPQMYVIFSFILELW